MPYGICHINGLAQDSSNSSPSATSLTWVDNILYFFVMYEISNKQFVHFTVLALDPMHLDKSNLNFNNIFPK